jgi:hypothetical protein
MLFLYSIYLAQRSSDGLVNQSETCSLYLRKKGMLCPTENLAYYSKVLQLMIAHSVTFFSLAWYISHPNGNIFENNMCNVVSGHVVLMVVSVGNRKATSVYTVKPA